MADTPKKRMGRPLKYPWDTMEHGDYYLASAAEAHSARIAARAWCAKNRPELEVVTRALDGGWLKIWFMERPVVGHFESNGGTETP